MMGLIVAPGAIANVYFRYFYVRETFSAGPQQLYDLGNVSQEFVMRVTSGYGSYGITVLNLINSREILFHY